MTYKHALKSLLVVGAAVGLSGCISVFPKAPPPQMYRFGAATTAAVATAPATARIARTPTAFTRPAAGDRMLTVNGQEIAYIAEARWVAPAALMFDDAVEHAFDSRESGPRLVTRGDLQTADMALRLDVDTFETRYLSGTDAAPTVVLSMTATLVRVRDRAVMGEKVFTAEKRAYANRVGAIAEAYDEAVKEGLDGMTDWVAGTVAAG